MIQLQQELSTPIKRFDFFRLKDFTAPDSHEAELIITSDDVEQAPPPPPPPSFSEAQLEKAKKEAFAEGVAEGIAQATDTQQKQQTETLQMHNRQIQQLATQLVTAQQAMQQQIAAQHKELLSLAGGLAVKLAGNALAENYMDAIASMLEQTLPELLTMPILILRVHEHAVDKTKELMQQMKQDYGYEGSYQVIPAGGLQAGDIKIEWQFGSAERSIQHIIASIEAVIPVPNTEIPAPKAIPVTMTERPDNEAEPALVGDDSTPDLQKRLQALRARKSS